MFCAGLVIPENDLSTLTGVISGSQEIKNVSDTENNRHKNILSTPPWKGGHSEGQNSSISKYSPAFKRKPFTVYSTGNVKPPSSRQNSLTNSSLEGQTNSNKRIAASSTGTTTHQFVSKSSVSPNALPTGRQAPSNLSKRLSQEGTGKPTTNTSRKSNPALVNKMDIDSDNDSAVSSARSSLSHSSGSACVSPPSSPPLGNCGKQCGGNTVTSRPGSKLSSFSEAIKETEAVDTRSETHTLPSVTNVGSDNNITSHHPISDKNPRVLKKHSVEAINRRNILESCKKSSAKGTMLIPPPATKSITTEPGQAVGAINPSSVSLQKAVSNSKYETNPTNTCRTTTPVAKERRSISSSSRATSFPLGTNNRIYFIYLFL